MSTEDNTPILPTGREAITGPDPLDAGLTAPMEPLTGPLPEVPGYELLGVLGQGGMGVVYQARQVKADRLVALKMIHAAGGLRGEPERFLLEARAIAAVRHPNIVEVYEVGEHQGRPYFSMEYCSGGSLDRRLGGTPLPDREAAALVEAIARAVHVAHQARILHRDLKPANVLLARRFTEDPVGAGSPRPASAPGRGDPAPTALLPKLTDFGLAKRLDEPGQTRTGAVMGTPSYMAPEQAEGKKDVGPAVDIYALGAILYECLTGRPPFRSARTLDTVLQVLSSEPVPPRQLNAGASRDLEVIALKCLDKDPRRRPASALELAEELRRFLDGKPILSRPVGRSERLWRWARRNPLLAGASALAGAALLAVVVLTVAFAVRERRHGNALRSALHDSRRRLAENYLDRALLDGAQLEPDERLLWLARGLQTAPADADALQRALRLNLAAWRRAAHQMHGLFAHPDVVRCVTLTADGRLMLAGGADGTTRVWDTRQAEPHGPPRKHPHPVLAVTFQGERPLALLAGDSDVRLVDAGTGAAVAGPFRHEEGVVAAAFSPDGKRLITGSGDHTACVWDLATGRRIAGPLTHDSAVIAVALSPDGRTALTGTLNDGAQLWDVTTTRKTGPAITHPGQVTAVAFSPDGKRLATGCDDNTARLFEAATRGHLADLIHRSDDGSVWAVAFSPDGVHLLTAGTDGTARLWDVETREPVGQALAHTDEVRAVAFSADGRSAATGGYDRTARCWRLAPPPCLYLGHDDPVEAGAFSRDGRLVVAGDRMAARLWHTATGRLALPPLPHPESVNAVAFSPNDDTFLTGCADGVARRWSVRTGEMVRSYSHGGPLMYVAFSGDGRLVATAGTDRTAALWDATTGRRLFLLAHDGTVHTARFSGDRLLTGSADGKARLWDTQTGRLVRAFPHGGSVWAAVFHADGRQIVTGSDDRHSRVWDADDPGRPLLSLPHLREVRAVACDGGLVATGCLDHTARVWDAVTGEPRTPPLRQRNKVVDVAFQPGGRLLASCGVDHTARLWDSALGRAVGPPLAHNGDVMALAFDPAGRTLLTCSRDGSARLWPVAEPLAGDAAHILLWTEAVTGKRLDTAGAIRFLDADDWRQRRREVGEEFAP